MSDELKLNQEQKEAIQHQEGPLLIVAGAGTGKTTVLTQRVFHLFNDLKLNTDEVLALTFTEKAAQEMEERIERALPFGYADLWVMTFHSFAQKILEDHGLDIGLPSSFRILDEVGTWTLIRKNLDKFDLDYYQPLGNPTKFIRDMLKHFSRCKDELIEPQDYLKHAEKLKMNKGGRATEDIILETKRLEEMANAYHTYQQILLDNEALDFGDLMFYCLKLFKERPNILKKYQEQFKHILIDEFQDTNYAQYQLIKLLAEPRNNITVVGDDDQCLSPNTKILIPNGKKNIKDFQIGDEILTAVGKGHMGISKVNHVFKSKKKTEFLTIKTKRGFKVEVTDNHKMFCHVPSANIVNQYTYVYLMWRKDIGWRIGITKNLTWRLSLERSADKILGIQACESEAAAHYYEQLYSLKYSIPTYCFKQRKGLSIKEDRLKNLYQQIDVESGVQRLGQDLNIDLSSFHTYLTGVIRGSKKRIKINLNLCQRRYRSKTHVKNQRELLKHYAVYHELNLQTSDQEVLKKLTSYGYQLDKAKIGKRLRITSKDLLSLKKDLKKIERITGGIVQAKAKIAKLNYQTLPALVIPAKNLLLGHYLPVKVENEIVYDEIVEIKSKTKVSIIYDLEVDRTHNFLAEGIVVHNSIYAFRGSSMNNILGFKKDYPQAKEVFLNQNYRSTQDILDLSYNFIQQNNPERLEIKLSKGKKKLSKKLSSNSNSKGEIEVIKARGEKDEVREVIKKIHSILKKEKDLSWNDFAVLVRANAHAKPFTIGFQEANIPYQFVASRGLYEKEIVLDIIAYLKLLDNYHESSAVWRVLNFPFWKLKPKDIINFSHAARKKAISIYAVVKNINYYLRIDEVTQKTLHNITSLVEKHTQLALEKNVWVVIWTFLNDSGYLKYIDSLDEAQKHEVFSYLGQFYKKVQSFENNSKSAKVRDFIEFFNLEIESGEKGKLNSEVDEGPEAVKIMTVHGSKGLEFKYVFLAGLVDKRFPSMERKEKIAIPDELVKEILPEGNIHLQEERRLFYVAMTRAKQGLYFTWAKDYGGVRLKKPSQFLQELNLIKLEEDLKTEKKVFSKEDLEINDVRVKNTITKADLKKLIPQQYSFTQLRAYQSCPRQYYYSHILKIPLQGKPVFSYGKTMHLTMQRFFQLIIGKAQQKQGDLFDNSSKKKSKDKLSVSLDELLKIYEEYWIDDWYSDANSKKKYQDLGRRSLREFYKKVEKKLPEVKYLEKGFNLKVGDYSLKGEIDRVDVLEDGVQIIDYKTGNSKEKLDADDKQQLLIYQIAYEAVFKEKVKNLKFYYLNDNTEIDFLGKPKDLEKVIDKLIDTIKKINSCDFTATPGDWTCKYCDFKDICPFKY